MSLPTDVRSCQGCPCHNTALPSHEIQQLVDLVKKANDASATMAEVARVQAHAILAMTERNSPKTQPSVPATAPAHTHSRSENVISERVGSISVEHWKGMSNESLGDLDRALKKLVTTTALEISWNEIGLIIHRELAAVGFIFKTVEECLPKSISRDWAVAQNTSLSDLVRMTAVASASRYETDTSRWWADEMVRIVVRLMELRGM